MARGLHPLRSTASSRRVVLVDPQRRRSAPAHRASYQTTQHGSRTSPADSARTTPHRCDVLHHRRRPSCPTLACPNTRGVDKPGRRSSQGTGGISTYRARADAFRGQSCSRARDLYGTSRRQLHRRYDDRFLEEYTCQIAESKPEPSSRVNPQRDGKAKQIVSTTGRAASGYYCSARVMGGEARLATAAGNSSFR